MCVLKTVASKRILIVDDDIDLLMLLERQLQKQGYELETAVSLSEAEEIISYFEPHLVLLDVNIRGQDGRQLCWKLKKQNSSSIKVVMISGFDYDASRAALFGADAVLPKPFNMQFLLNKVETMVS